MLEYCVQYKFGYGAWFEVAGTRTGFRSAVIGYLEECELEDADRSNFKYRIAVRAPGQWQELED